MDTFLIVFSCLGMVFGFGVTAQYLAAKNTKLSLGGVIIFCSSLAIISLKAVIYIVYFSCMIMLIIGVQGVIKKTPKSGKKNIKTSGLLVLGAAILFSITFYGYDVYTSRPTYKLAEERERQSEAAIKNKEQEDAKAQVVDTKLVNISANWGLSGSVLIMGTTLENKADFAIQDIDMACGLFAQSQTPLGMVTKTIYQRIPPKKSIFVPAVNMGFVSDQTHSIGCVATGYKRAN